MWPFSHRNELDLATIVIDQQACHCLARRARYDGVHKKRGKLDGRARSVRKLIE
jgi:hypothetical protein